MNTLPKMFLEYIPDNNLVIVQMDFESGTNMFSCSDINWSTVWIYETKIIDEYVPKIIHGYR